MTPADRTQTLPVTALIAAVVGGGSAALVLALAPLGMEQKPETSLRELRVRRLEALAASGVERLSEDLAELELATLEALAHDGPIEGTLDDQAWGERVRSAVEALRVEELAALANLKAALREAQLEARLDRLAQLAGLELEQTWRVRAQLERR